MCKICIARRLVVDIFPWCNANFVPFPSGTLVARRMRNGSIAYNCTFYEISWIMQMKFYELFHKIERKSLPYGVINAIYFRL